MVDAVKIVCLLKRGSSELAAACADLSNVAIVTVAPDPSSIEAEISDADVLVANNAFYTADVAQLLRRAAPRLRWIQFLSTGYNNAESNGLPDGVTLTNAGSIYAPPVAEHAMALLLALVRQVPQMERNRLRRHWDQLEAAEPLDSLRERSLLAVGFGGIGREIAKLSQPLDMRVIGVARTSRDDPLAERVIALEQLPNMLSEADAVALSLPLSDETKGLFGKAAFSAMKQSAVFVNVGRGAVVDTDALVAALRERQIAGAALDVYPTEPLHADSPLWDLENVIISPHIGGWGFTGTMRDLVKLARDNIGRFIAGEPLNNILNIS